MIHSNKSHHQRAIPNESWMEVRESGKRGDIYENPRKKSPPTQNFTGDVKTENPGKSRELPKNTQEISWIFFGVRFSIFFWNYSKIFHFFPRNFPDSWFLGFLVSRFLGFSVSRFLGFSVSRYLGFSVSRFLGFSVSRFLDFSDSRFLGFSGLAPLRLILGNGIEPGFIYTSHTLIEILCVHSSSAIQQA